MFKEVAMVIDRNNRILDVQLGEPALVYFPQEFMLEQHKREPGSILTMAHTHESMFDFSHEDITTLKAWAMAFYPHPISMDVIVYQWLGNMASQYRKTYQYVKTDGVVKLNEYEFKIDVLGLNKTYQDEARLWMELIGKLSYA